MKRLFIVLLLCYSSFSIAQNDNAIELPVGWSLFGFNCQEPIDAATAFSPITESIVILKDYLGNVYLPEYGVNTIGNLEYGKGYQIKMIYEVNDFEFCEINCSDTALNTDSLQQLIDSNMALIIDLQEQLSLYGCTVDSACNYSFIAEIDNGTCEFAITGFDCEGNELQVTYEVGDFIQGGIVFYLDEAEGFGLVAALEDLSEGANMGEWGVSEGYEWACLGSSVSGANATDIGAGYQNTVDIILQNCLTVNGGVSAAQAAFNYEWEGYTDWYLPSKAELNEMYNSIGDGGLYGNVGSFYSLDGSTSWYWSSSETASNYAWNIAFNSGYNSQNGKSNSNRVRAIRTFQINELLCNDSDSDGICDSDEISGCLDVLACNYDAAATDDSDLCIYSQEGFDCDGLELQIYSLGDLAYGGIVFFVDETGYHGLVAAPEDLPNMYEWGCYSTNLAGAYNEEIGSGFQNTLDILADCSQSQIAASESFIYENQGYSDWYLPSKNELLEMYNTIGPGGELTNIGGFETEDMPWYWSSTVASNTFAWYVSLNDGYTNYANKNFTRRVRVIRSF